MERPSWAFGVFAWMVLTFSSRTAELFAPPQIRFISSAARADGLSPGSQVNYLGVTVGTGGNGHSKRGRQRLSTSTGWSIAIPRCRRICTGPSSAPARWRWKRHQPRPSTGDRPQGVLAADAPAIPTEYVGLQLNLIPPSLSQTAGQIGQVSDEISKTLKTASRIRVDRGFGQDDQDCRRSGQESGRCF